MGARGTRHGGARGTPSITSRSQSPARAAPYAHVARNSSDLRGPVERTEFCGRLLGTGLPAQSSGEIWGETGIIRLFYSRHVDWYHNNSVLYRNAKKSTALSHIINTLPVISINAMIG